MRHITPTNDSGAAIEAHSRAIRLPIVRDLGAGLYITTKPAWFARLSKTTQHKHGVARCVALHTYALHTQHGVAIVGSDTLDKLLNFAVRLAALPDWPRVAAATSGPKQVRVWLSINPKYKSNLKQLAESLT